MALVEMHVILAWVLRRFKLSKAPKFALENWGGSVVSSLCQRLAPVDEWLASFFVEVICVAKP